MWLWAPLNPKHRALNPAELQLRHKQHSLLQCHLPVKLLCHRGPGDVPLEELRVDTPEDELSPVLIGGLAAKKNQSYSSRDEEISVINVG